MSLIIPKNNADPKTLFLALEVYKEAGDWVDNSTLIESLRKKLREAGIEDGEREPQSYTKKTQVLSYYGFIEWEEPDSDSSRRRITTTGKEFYDALKAKNQIQIDEILLESLATKTFGRNVLGCHSDSDVEAPNVFVKASILLDGLTNQEFAFIVYNMDAKGEDFSTLVAEIRMMRNLDKPITLANDAKKYSDPKPITALKGWGFLEAGANKRVFVNKELLNLKWHVLCSLRTKNTEAQVIPVNDERKDVSKFNERQIIFYGAPGTGKSHTINDETNDEDVIRTTFHPDSDYSTFVGAYKPTMESNPRYTDNGTLITYNGGKKAGMAIMENEIVYKFIDQAFLKAYKEAWRKFCENEVTPMPQFLVIEEINRGNCAQIFGDLFQLLDRNDEGFSEYPITADDDVRIHLEDAFSEYRISMSGHAMFRRMYRKKTEDIAQDVLDGKLLILPSNLYIWATMNTSDQSLFPIDSAFKRRWDWHYVRISNAHYDWKIEAGGKKYDWWAFLTKVNAIIQDLTLSDDKKLGYFFCKAKDGIINAETFTNKVVFYLWNEIFKDSPTDELGKYLKGSGDNKTIDFQSFYKEDEDGDTVIDEETVGTFLSNIGVKSDDATASAGESTTEEGAE